jgi:hypothetical protein
VGHQGTFALHHSQFRVGTDVAREQLGDLRLRGMAYDIDDIAVPVQRPLPGALADGQDPGRFRECLQQSLKTLLVDGQQQRGLVMPAGRRECMPQHPTACGVFAIFFDAVHGHCSHGAAECRAALRLRADRTRPPIDPGIWTSSQVEAARVLTVPPEPLDCGT